MIIRTSVIVLATTLAITTPALASEGHAVVVSGTAVANAYGTHQPRLLTQGDPVEAGDTVGFAEGAIGGVELEEGTRLLTTAGMLVWIGEVEERREISVAYGEALVESVETPVLVTLVDGVVELLPGSAVLVTTDTDKSRRVDLLKGEAHVGWNAGTVALTEDMRAWPLLGGLGWARRTLTRPELRRRGAFPGGTSRPEDVIPLLANQPPLDDGDIYEPTPLCDASWHLYPWIECRLTGWGCACYDTRGLNWFYYDEYERYGADWGNPQPGAVTAVSTPSSSGPDEDKDVPEEPADLPSTDVDTSGIVDGALFLGMDREGNIVSWRGRSAAGFTSVVAREDSTPPRFYSPDGNGSTYVDSDAYTPRSGHSSHQSGSSTPNTSSYGEFGGGGSGGGSPSREATWDRGSSGGASSSGSASSGSSTRSRSGSRSSKKSSKKK